MKIILVLSLVLSFVLTAFGQNFIDASLKKNVTARVPLAEVTNIKNADPLETSNVPNYIKALAQTTKAARVKAQGRTDDVAFGVADLRFDLGRAKALTVHRQHDPKLTTR